jgi:hypothetical protein
MTHIDSISTATQLQAHTAELHAPAQVAKAAAAVTAAVSDPDHDGDNDSGGMDSDHGTDVKA